MENTILSGCDFSNTDLKDAKLTNADLHYAKLTDADLKKSDLTGCDLRETLLPDGFCSKDQGEQLKHLKDLKIEGIII